MRLKRVLILAGIALALVAVGVGWGDLTIEGRDVLTADAGGADLLAAGKGSDLLYGPNWTALKYPFVSSAVTLRAVGISSSDIGYVYVKCLNASGVPAADSVLLTSAYLEKTYTGPCASVLAVNFAAFHDDSTNVNQVMVYHGSGRYAVADSQLAVIAPRQGKAVMAQTTLPASSSQLQVSQWEIYPTTTFASVASTTDSISTGHVGLLARKPGAAWEEVRGFDFNTRMGPVFVYPPAPEIYDLPGLTQLVVAAGVTGAATDLYFRARIGIR